MTEDQLQSQIFQWHWNNRPQERRRLFHVNQKARNAIEGNRMKAMGVVPGVSDLIYLHPSGVYFLELKTETGIQSPEQKAFAAVCATLSLSYRIIRTLEEFQHFISNPYL